ncbi:MAG: GTP-dependent dephospho-CoA kinase family protein [Thaumarchaeota archaeon]|nr:GTP-dependent dephospho-CoA kinase family protein [Nitrososphaerota archaeon]
MEEASRSPLSSSGDYVLNPGLRRKLKRPIGQLFPSVDVQGEEFLSVVTSSSLVVTVGDRVTERLQEITGRSPDVFVVDGMERRAVRDIPKVAHASVLRAKNPAGGITEAARRTIKKAFKAKKPVMVIIEGEEDLLALPAVVDAPTGSVVFYGQPLVGVVAVKVDERSKAIALEMLRRMST